MGSTLLKLIVLSLCLNTFLYLGVNYAMYEVVPPEQRPDLQNDLFSILMDDPEGTRENLDVYVENLGGDNVTTGYSLNPSGNFSQAPSEKTGFSVNIDQGGLVFIDVARMVIPLITTLWRIGTMPLTLFSYHIFPPLVAVIIALPLFLLNIITVLIFIRGGGGS